MAENILRLRVESAEYDNKLKSAANGLTRYIEGCRKVGGTLEVVEKETLQYAQSLGNMETKSRSAVSGLNEMKKAFVDLSVQYRGLTDAEKSSKFGEALSGSLDTLRSRISDTKAAMSDIERKISQPRTAVPTKGEDNEKWYVKFGSIASGVNSTRENLSQVVEQVHALTEAYAIQEEAELKLETVMRQRMSATDEEVDSIKRLASAQQTIGVIGDEVQLAGAQQVATFLKCKESIEELLPAMNNLAVQQHGLNVSSEDMVNIGNMVGKVMQGQTGALRRVGITFTEAQENAMKYGDEIERAKALAQVITNNVGNMNAALAKTDAGKAKQMANDFGDWQEELGKAFAKYEPLMQGFAQLGIVSASVLQVGGTFLTLGKAMASATVVQKAFTVAQASFAAMSNLVTASVTGTTLSLSALRAGIRGTIVSLGLIGVAYMAVSTAVEALAKGMGLLDDQQDSAKKKTESMTEAQRRQAEEAERSAARQRRASQTAGEAVGEVEGKFRTFQAEWKRLSSVADQTSWIKKNQSAFADMGLAIGSVNEANRIFVKDSEKVIRALKAIAEADAYKEEYGKAKAAEAKAGRNGSVSNGAYYRTAKAGQRFADDEIPELVAAGIISQEQLEQRKRHRLTRPSYDHTDDRYTLTVEDAKTLNDYRRRQAADRRRDYLSPYQQNSAFWAGKMEAAQSEAASAKKYIESLGHPYTETPTPAKVTPHRSTGVSAQGDAIDQELRANSDKIKTLSHEFVGASEERRKAIQGEIADLKARNGAIEETIALAKGESKAKEEVKAPDTVTGPSGLNAPTIAVWRQGKENDLGRLDLGTGEGMSQAIRIEADMNSMDTLQQAVSDALGKGLVLPPDAVGGLYDAIFNEESIPDDQIQAWVDAINGKLHEAGLGEIDIKTRDDGSGDKQIRTLERGAETTKKGWQDAARAMQSVGSALQGIEDPASKVAGIVAEAVANIALSFAQATAKDSKLGVLGWIAAIAAGTATMIATISSIRSATRHAAGGIVGGNSPSGDNLLMGTTGVPALVNSGELVLNRAQQGNLASQLEQGGLGQTSHTPYVSGETIYLGLSNYLRGRGYGEIVTTNRK